MHSRVRSIHSIFLLMIFAVAGTSCTRVGPPRGVPDRYNVLKNRSNAPDASGGGISTSQMLRQVNLKVDMIPRGTHGRKVVRTMKPRYITIHSTQNYTAGAERHSLALKRGALRSAKTRYGNRIGYLTWHFTVDDETPTSTCRPTNRANTPTSMAPATLRPSASKCASIAATTSPYH